MFPTLQILENRYNKSHEVLIYCVKAPKRHAVTGVLNPYCQFVDSLQLLGQVPNISNDLLNYSSPEMRFEYNSMI